MRVIWNTSTDIFDVIHPLGLNGPTPIGDEDFFFIGNVNEFTIYSWGGWSADRSEHDPPNIYVSTVNIDGYGYGIYKSVYISYSLVGFRLHSTVDGDYTQASYPYFYDFMKKYISDTKYSLYSMANVNEYIAYTPFTFNLNTTTESDWDTVAGGNSPVFEVDKVTPEYTQVPTINYSATNRYSFSFTPTYATSVSSGDQENLCCARNNHKAIVSLGRSSGGNPMLNIAQINVDYTAFGTPTAYTAVNSTSAYTLGQRMSIEPVNGEHIAINCPGYTGSKTDQGEIEIISVAADYTMTKLATVNANPAARNGHLGSGGMCLCLVDDSTYGEDLQLITVDDANEEIYVFSRERGWALHQTITLLERNDYIRHLSGYGELFAFEWRDDSAAAYMITAYMYNGSSWAWGTTLNNGSDYISNNLAAMPKNRFSYMRNTEDVLVVRGWSGASWANYLTRNIYQGAGSTYGGPQSDTEAYACGFGTYYYDTELCRIIEPNGGYNLVGDINGTSSNYPSSRAIIFPPDESSMMAWSQNTMWIYPATTTLQFTTGWTAIKSGSANARFTPGTPYGDFVVGGSSVYSELNCTMSWAVSIDGGLNWQYWDGSAWQTADIDNTTATGNLGDLIYFDGGMDDLKDDTFTAIDFCFRWDVPSTPSTCGYLESFNINHAETLETSRDVEMNKGGNLHSVQSSTVDPHHKITLDIYDTPDNEQYWFNVAFFDDLL